VGRRLVGRWICRSVIGWSIMGSVIWLGGRSLVGQSMGLYCRLIDRSVGSGSGVKCSVGRLIGGCVRGWVWSVGLWVVDLLVGGVGRSEIGLLVGSRSVGWSVCRREVCPRRVVGRSRTVCRLAC